jgi:hypothetical protein
MYKNWTLGAEGGGGQTNSLADISMFNDDGDAQAASSNELIALKNQARRNRFLQYMLT